MHVSPILINPAQNVVPYIRNNSLGHTPLFTLASFCSWSFLYRPLFFGFLVSPSIWFVILVSIFPNIRLIWLTSILGDLSDWAIQYWGIPTKCGPLKRKYSIESYSSPHLLKFSSGSSLHQPSIIRFIFSPSIWVVRLVLIFPIIELIGLLMIFLVFVFVLRFMLLRLKLK